MNLLIDCLTQCTLDKYTNIVVGDFNCPAINWTTLNCPNDSINRPLLDFIIDHGFCQYVNFATCGKNILDIILTDDEQLVTAIASDAPCYY